MKVNYKKLNTKLSAMINETSTSDCVGNLTIGYLMIWGQTLEQNSEAVISLSKFQESLIERYQATTDQIAEAFFSASTTFEELTGIPVPHEVTDWFPMTPNFKPLERELYLN
jgi:hypothetical protein